MAIFFCVNRRQLNSLHRRKLRWAGSRPAHEVAHTLGLVEIRNDAYGDGISDHVYGGSAECIMGGIDSARIYDMLVDGQSAFCDYCKQKMHEEIDEVDLYEPREG